MEDGITQHFIYIHFSFYYRINICVLLKCICGNPNIMVFGVGGLGGH